MKYRMFFYCFFMVAVFLSAQSTASEIEVLLNTKAITYSQAARFTLEAANVQAFDNPGEAFNYAVQQGWLPGNVGPDDSARLDRISLLLMRAFNIGGGIMYSITGNSHYAYRELVYINVIQRRSDPAMFVSGERLLFYVGRLLSLQEK